MAVDLAVKNVTAAELPETADAAVVDEVDEAIELFSVGGHFHASSELIIH